MHQKIFVSVDGADAIVVGTHGLSAVKSLVVSSVARKVLRAAQCSVVAVR